MSLSQPSPKIRRRDFLKISAAVSSREINRMARTISRTTLAVWAIMLLANLLPNIIG